MKQRSGGMIFLGASFACGLLAALLTISYLQGQTQVSTVLIAVEEIAPFTPLKASQFALQDLPLSVVPADAIMSPGQLEGKYARTLILKGTAMRLGHLTTATGSGSTMAARLSEQNAPAHRAFAVAVDKAQGVAGTVQAGDKVDVITAVRIEPEGEPGFLFAKVMAAAVPVLYKSEAESSGKQHVVLMVTPQQAEELAFAQMAGQVMLATNPYQPNVTAAMTQGTTADQFYRRHGR